MVMATNLTSICCVNKEKLLKTMPFKRRLVGRQVSLLSMFLRHLADKKIVVLSALCLKQIQILWSINDVQMRRKKSWIIGCNISLIGLELNFFTIRVNLPVCMLYVVFNNFLLTDATDRSKISSDQRRFFYRTKPIPPFIFREHSL